MEAVVPAETSFRSEPRAGPGLEPRRLSGRGARPLRRVSHAAQLDVCNQKRCKIWRRRRRWREGCPDAELADSLAIGQAEGHGGASGNRAEAVDLSLRPLPRGDIESIVTSLKTVPPQQSGDPEIVQADPPSLAVSTAWSVPP